MADDKPFPANAIHVVRTAQTINVQLSAMADQKASILMGATFVITTHPAVADAAVVRRADERRGEVPVAVVVRRADVGEAELIAWAAERVAPYKRLHAVRFADAIPRTPSGKLLRRVIVA